MKNPRVVCDLTVFLEAALHPGGAAGELLRRFAREREVELLLSPPLASRLDTAFHDPEVLEALGESAEEIDRWLAALGVLAEMVDVERARDESRLSSADLEVLQLAKAAGDALVISTGDELASSLGEFGLEVYEPRAILDLLDARSAVGQLS